MSDSGSNRRQKAAAARDAANAGEKRRERTVRIVGAVTVVIVVAAIIGIAVYAKNSSSATASGELVTATADPNAPSPKGVLAGDDEHAYGVPYGTAAGTVPVLAIWEDFQCPACGKVESANGEGIAALAESGKVQLIWRPTTFLDGNLQNDASVRAVAAWGCAIDAGKVREYHDAVYKNQPTKEGDGYTNEQLIAFAGDAGISGDAATAFQQCVTDGTYLSWAANSTKIFYDSKLPGTPYATLNGQEVGLDVLSDAAKLEAAVASVAKQ